MMLKDMTCIIPINFWLLKIYSIIFFNEFFMLLIFQDLVYLGLISKSSQHQKIKICNGHPCTKS